MKAKELTTRRLFFRNAGAVLSAPLAVAAAQAAPGAAGDGDVLKARLAMLEDLEAIRELNRAYARHLNAGDREALASLFADPADAALDPRIRGVSAAEADPEVIELAAHGGTAAARLHCSVQVEAPIETSCTLVEMARLQGGGFVKRFEHGVFENVYVKQRGDWKIRRATYRAA